MESAQYPFALRERLGGQGVIALAEVLEAQQSETVTLAIQTFESRLGEECARIRAELIAEMRQLRTELRADFKVEVANVRADLLKWSFVFWIGQFAAVIAYIAIIR